MNDTGGKKKKETRKVNRNKLNKSFDGNFCACYIFADVNIHRAIMSLAGVQKMKFRAFIAVVSVWCLWPKKQEKKLNK